MITGAILLVLVFNTGIAAASEGEETHADLNVSKVVSSPGPYTFNDEVTWVVTLTNNGPANATSIMLQEDISQLTGLKNLTTDTDRGIYNTTTNTWSIDELDNATSATLTIKTNFTAAGVKTNRITITGLNETDPVPDNNQAEAVVQFNTSGSMDEDEPLSANLVIRPTTLDINSKGVFTVYITLTGVTFNTAEGGKKPRVDYANSTLTCGGADMIRASVSAKDGGTLIAKFHRSDLENVTPGEGGKINCSGALVVNGNTVNVQGNDTIRVIGEKKGLDNILSRLWKFLGIEKDDIEINESEDGNITVTFSLNPDNFKNSGQIKKILKQDNKSDRGEGNEIAVSEQTQIREENQVKNNGDDKQNREKNIDNKSDKDNKGKDKRNDESAGKSAGKKNT
jgi:uncharacterized repeat protein (TIGR01451 family)